MKHYRRRRYEQVKIRDILMKWAIDIIVVIGIALFLVVYLGETATVVGYSMEPSLLNGDRLLINKLQYELSSPERFDVVVFQPNLDT
ncbi:MAG: signal peptidase I, partial [Clostridiales bacterium]|nr:signal peptidase I [Clostridiales bacterium]